MEAPTTLEAPWKKCPGCKVHHGAIVYTEGKCPVHSVKQRTSLKEALLAEIKEKRNKRYYETITHADEDLKVIQARSMEIGHNRALGDVEAIINKLMP